MQPREFTDLDDLRLVWRGNRILSELFRNSVSSVRQLCLDEASAKGCYRFLHNERVSEDDIILNLVANCRAASMGKNVVCLQDTTQINLMSHKGRLHKDDYIGPTNKKAGGPGRDGQGLGFLLHPCLVVDATEGIPYGYADVKLWSRPHQVQTKVERKYWQMPIKEKESYRWIEVSANTKEALGDTVGTMIIVQDREGDIYEQFATIPDQKTDLLVRARANRKLAGGEMLFDCLSSQPVAGTYELIVDATRGKARSRTVQIAIRYRRVQIPRPRGCKDVAPCTELCFIEARQIREQGKEDKDKGSEGICWRLLTSIGVESVEIARMCIEWYSWRWMMEEVFKVLKKEGYNIEGSELEYGSSVRKLTLMTLEVIIKLFLMRFAYSEPELELDAGSCFSLPEQEYLEHQIKALEGRTQRSKNPYGAKDLKRYVWAIARMGGWKGYESKRRPGITTLWLGLKAFNAAYQGWELHRNVSTR